MSRAHRFAFLLVVASLLSASLAEARPSLTVSSNHSLALSSARVSRR